MSTVSESHKKYFYRDSNKSICINLSMKSVRIVIGVWLSFIIFALALFFYQLFFLKVKIGKDSFYWVDLNKDINEVYQKIQELIPQLNIEKYQKILQTEGQYIEDSLKLSIHSLSRILSQIPLAFPFEYKWKLGSTFGLRIDPLNRKEAFHSGVDILATNNTSIYSTAEGIVEDVGYSLDYGYFIKIKHSYGFFSIFAHMLALSDFKVGDTLQKGVFVGYVGSSGRSSGPHLHYEILSHDYYLNPLEYLELIESDGITKE